LVDGWFYSEYVFLGQSVEDASDHISIGGTQCLQIICQIV